MAIEERNDYDPWEQAFAGHLNPEILINAVDDHESALKAHRKAHKYDAPAEWKREIAKLLKEYQ